MELLEYKGCSEYSSFTKVLRHKFTQNSYDLEFTTSSVTICPLNNSFKPNHACPCLGFGKVFNVLNSPIGQKASRLKRDVEKLPLKALRALLGLNV